MTRFELILNRTLNRRFSVYRLSVHWTGETYTTAPLKGGAIKCRLSHSCPVAANQIPIRSVKSGKTDRTAA